MSNYLAIAGVTLTIMNMLAEAFVADFPAAGVTSLRPDAASGGSVPEVRANLYLYQIAHNPHWRNEDLGVRRASGELAQRPLVAIDLHYLITFHGADAGLEPQRLLGSAVHALDARPVLTPDLIVHALSAYAKNLTYQPFIASIDLANQIERVKLTPLPLSLEELSKLWSTFFQAPYQLSVTYQAVVVFIEGRESPRPALPVLARNLYVNQIRTPIIEEVMVEPEPGENVETVKPILPDSVLLIRGQRLRGEDGTTFIRIFGADVDLATLNPSETVVTNTYIRLRLSDVQAAGVVPRAGAQGLQVIQTIQVGAPSALHATPLFESNVAPFVLHPSVSGASVTSVSGRLILSVQLAPVSLDSEQRVLAHLYPQPPTAPLSAGNILPALPRVSPSAVATFSVDDLKALPSTTYLLSVQVDGAASPLTTGASGVYTGPTVTIP